MCVFGVYVCVWGFDCPSCNVCCNRRRASSGATSKGNGAAGNNAAAQKVQEKLQEAMDGMAVNAQITADTVKESRELKEGSGRYAEAAKRLREKKKKKKFLGLF